MQHFGTYQVMMKYEALATDSVQVRDSADEAASGKVEQ